MRNPSTVDQGIQLKGRTTILSSVSSDLQIWGATGGGPRPKLKFGGPRSKIDFPVVKFGGDTACFAEIWGGGMGLPMVIAIIIFLSYHFIGIFAKNSAEDGSISPFIATWLSTLIMLPLGIYFTYRATTDQGLFSFDIITEPISKFFKKIGLVKPKDK